MAIDYDLQPGQMVGEYRVERKIGEGGFGKVYAAVHPVIGKAAAIKILNPDLAKNQEMVSRFISEARAVNQIRHRNIIDIFAFGSLPNGLNYFVMEMLEGETLDSYLRKNAPLAVGHALSLLWPVGRALVAAHKAGITHRDLKPENVFLVFEEDGGIFPKLLDFGIAKLLHESEMAHRTRTGAMLGTPVYMSPEQCRGAGIDHRSDIYSFGIMVHEVLTGARPFNGETLMDLLMKQVSSPAPPMSASRPDLPRSLDAPVLHMLEKAPDRRPESMQAALDELARAAESAGIPLPSSTVGPASRLSAQPAGRPSATPSNVTPSPAVLDTNAWLHQQAGVPSATGAAGAAPHTGPGRDPSAPGVPSPVAATAPHAPTEKSRYAPDWAAGQGAPATPTPHPSMGAAPANHPSVAQQAAPPGAGWTQNAQPVYPTQPAGYPQAAGYPAGAPAQEAPAKKRPPSAIGIVAAIAAGVFFLFIVGFIALVVVAGTSSSAVQLGHAAPEVGKPVSHQATSDLEMKLSPAGAAVPIGATTIHTHREYQITPQSVNGARANRVEIRYFDDSIQMRSVDGSQETEASPTANRAFSVAGTWGSLVVSSVDGSPVSEEARDAVLRDVGPYFEAVPAIFTHPIDPGDTVTPSSEVVVSLLGLTDTAEGVRVRADHASFRLKEVSGDDAQFEATFLYAYDDEHIHLTAPLTGTLTFDTDTGLFVRGKMNGPVSGTFMNEKGRMNVSGAVAMEAR